MTISRKSPWWLAPALLLALGCGSDVEVAKFQVEDEKPETEVTATKSNSEFAGKAESDAPADGGGEEAEMAAQEQEPAKKPAVKKPAAKAEEEEPESKKISDMQVPKEGDGEVYEKFIKELLTMQPESEKENKQRIELLGSAADKILEVEKDKESERFKMASDIKSQIALVAIVPLLQAVVGNEGEKKEAAQKELQTAIDKYLEPHHDQKASEQMAASIGRLAQMLMQAPDDGLMVVNKTLIEKFAPKFEEAESEDLKKFAERLRGLVRMAEGMKRFGTLVGNEMELTGKTTEDKDFDIKSLKGKVVLVDFWATWCGPCVKEYPNLLKNYNTYHEKGFEIVGVSGDRALTDLTTYIEKKKVPWPNLYTEGGHAAMEYYGITGIPTMILVGRDGKVISTEARGPELDRLLEEEFAKSEPAAEGEKKEEKKEAAATEKKEAAAEEKKEESAEKKETPAEKKEEPKSE